MNDAPDHELLERYARDADDAAFGELVRRHLDHVHSAARRMVVDPHLAEDVSQAAFVALARQAGGVAGRVRAGMPLSAWLHRVARNHGAKTVRGEERRRAREGGKEREDHGEDAGLESVGHGVTGGKPLAAASAWPPQKNRGAAPRLSGIGRRARCGG